MRTVSAFGALNDKNTVGIIAPSSPCEIERFARGKAYLEHLGVFAKVALDPCREFGKTTYLFSSDSAAARAEALHTLAQDPSVGAILAARGAYGALELLPLLDFDLLKKFPKPLIGFSDTTALLLALSEHAWWPCIHGPSLESAFSKAHAQPEARGNAELLLGILQGSVTNPLSGLKVDRILGRGEARGALMGGNLSLIGSLVGTPWQPSLDGKILFLEEVGEKPYRIHRLLLQLHFAGMLKQVKAVLLGEFLQCEHAHASGPTLTQVFESVFGPLDIPIFGTVPCGHGARNHPLPFGHPVVLDGLGVEFLK